MWSCSLLKANARQALRGRYWRSFWVCLVVSLLGGGYTSLNLRSDWDDTYSTLSRLPTSALLIILAAALLGFVLAFLWATFFLNPLTVGSYRYFMESRQGGSPFRTMFGIFQTPYLNVVKVRLLVGLKLLGGFILLVIPYIYWSYCYALVPYLLAENPYLTTTRAMELSKAMMYGEKFHLFLLGLSFIGWDLLCILTFGFGFYFLAPYKYATYAEFYAAMRAKALAQGLSTTHELGGFIRHDASEL